MNTENSSNKEDLSEWKMQLSTLQEQLKTAKDLQYKLNGTLYKQELQLDEENINLFELKDKLSLAHKTLNQLLEGQYYGTYEEWDSVVLDVYTVAETAKDKMVAYGKLTEAFKKELMQLFWLYKSIESDAEYLKSSTVDVPLINNTEFSNEVADFETTFSAFVILYKNFMVNGVEYLKQNKEYLEVWKLVANSFNEFGNLLEKHGGDDK